MNKFINFIKKHWIVIVLSLVIIGAFSVRFYNFNEWLYFKSDQVRDAKLAATAFENGPGELSLLGPRAAGTFLRLGPIFYYQEYLSVKISNSIEPHIFVFPDLLFSLLIIPLLFIFLRNFFSKKVSLLITTLYAFSFIIIQYSRFAWNPNQIPFWGVLFSLSLLKIHKEIDKKKAGWWLVLLGFSYGVVSQLHFVAFVGFPIIAFLFWIIYLPRKINWRYWLGAVSVGLFLYVPVIVSDFFTKGDNLKQFLYAITAKTGDQALGLIENCRIIAVSLFMFLTSFGHKDGVLSAWLGVMLIVFGVGALLYFWKKEKESRPFAYLILIWFFVFMILQVKTNISLKTIFFMQIAVLP
nr:glycosyltransferase family 39 protein [Patescibacteria group bacterium]